MGRNFFSSAGRRRNPGIFVSREGYFETYEISVLLDYLRILDNARQDLPLTAVLTSPFVGLDAEELGTDPGWLTESAILRVCLAVWGRKNGRNRSRREWRNRRKRKERKEKIRCRSGKPQRRDFRSGQRKAGRVYEAGQILQKHTFLYSDP